MDDEMVSERSKADRYGEMVEAYALERAENARLRTERDEARAEVERLRAIIEGRTTPPTDVQVRALRVAGGSWWWCEDAPGGHTAGEAWTLGTVRRVAKCYPRARWWARDRRGAPCAPPKVTP